MSPVREQRFRVNARFFAATVVLFTAIFLRGLSFSWNTRLYGDVNLFALTAQQIARHGQLSYPMKYDYSPNTPYLTLSSPAGQHPPLVPLLAGGLARVGGTEETFPILKLLSMVFGILILLPFYKITTHEGSVASWVSFALLAYSPWLVDYSANGSLYSLIACLLLASQWVWWRWDDVKNIKLIGAAILSGIGWLTHGILIPLPLAFLLRILSLRSQKMLIRIKRLGIFLGIFFLLIVPWLLWNYATYGKLFYSSSTYYLLEQLGMAQIQVHNNVVEWVVQQLELNQIVHTYLLLISKATYAGLRDGISVITLWGVLLGLLGLFLSRLYTDNPLGTLSKRNWRQIVLIGGRFFFSPLGLYILTVFLWGTYKLRFLIPILPFVYVEIGKGFAEAFQQMGWRKWLGWGLLAGVFLGMALPYFQGRPNLYYGAETKHNALMYDQMQPLAVQMGKLPPGVVLGIADSLDGGIETIYWSKQPFVVGRGFNTEVWQKLVRDFGVRYIWCDQDQEEEVLRMFPKAKMLLSNYSFGVVQLP